MDNLPIPWQARLVDLRDYNSDYLAELAATPARLLADLVRVETQYHQIENQLLENGMNLGEASKVALERSAAPSTYGREENRMAESAFNKILKVVSDQLLPQALNPNQPLIKPVRASKQSSLT